MMPSATGCVIHSADRSPIFEKVSSSPGHRARDQTPRRLHVPIAVAGPQVQIPVSPHTLGRARVLGASHSLWLLDEPTRAERQRRGLRLAYTEFTNERTALREIQRMPGVGSDLDREIERRPSRMISTAEPMAACSTCEAW